MAAERKNTMKKIFGVILLALFGFSIYLSYADGDFYAAYFTSPIEAAGYYLGYALSMIPFLGGMILLTFDSVNKMPRHKAVAVRKVQVFIIFLLFILSSVFLCLTVWALATTNYRYGVLLRWIALEFGVLCCPLLIATAIYAYMLKVYCWPFKISQYRKDLQ